MNYFLLICFVVLIFETICTNSDDQGHNNGNDIDLSNNSNYLKIFEKTSAVDTNNYDRIKNSFSQLNLKNKSHLGRRKQKELQWWQKSVIYQLYPKSFKDSNGDGEGDLKGIIEKIPYLKDLGIGAVWLNPIYPSSGFDLGYDITEYKQIDKLFGSMTDFDELIEQCHKNGIKIILDFVPNHTSEEHEWFIKSVKKIDPYTDYYVWADAKYENGTRQVPNNWLSSVDFLTMWEWNENRQQYYLHQFYKQMPDLNFWNPLVREEMKNILRFWLEKGVDGFRVDAANHIYERKDLMDAPPNSESSTSLQKNGYTQCLDEVYEEIASWRSMLDEYKKVDGESKILIIESYSNNEYLIKYYGNSSHPGAHFPLNLSLLKLIHAPAKSFVNIINEWLQKLPEDAWSSWIIGNHDTRRATTKFGEQLIDGIIMIQMLLPGTPVSYMADEIGMTNTYLREDQILSQPYNKTGGQFFREQSRTPFQWNSKAQAGFSSKSKTWLPVNPNYVTLNVEFQQNAANSHLKVFKKLVELRRLDAFRLGDLELYEISNYVFAFSRSNCSFKTYFVVINLGSEIEDINMMKLKRLLPCKMKVKIASVNAEQNAGDIVTSKSISLRPNAALVLESNILSI